MSNGIRKYSVLYSFFDINDKANNIMPLICLLGLREVIRSLEFDFAYRRHHSRRLVALAV